MCGICGEVNFNNQPISLASITGMNFALGPRGPDAEGVVGRGRWALGHRRLTIIDLSERSAQPMNDEELGLTVVFNGCIYNYRELRGELEGKGYRFFSDGDTEVVLKAYHAWGEGFAARLTGMFAIAIIERESGRLILARDRLGIKPLYLATTPNGLRFASTLPAILAGGRDDIDLSIDPVAFQFYMTLHAVVPAPLTMLKGVRKLPAATVRVVEPDGAMRDQVYWSLSFEKSSADIARPTAEWQELLHETLATAVKRRMIADVPVGVLLSGGVDSSLIVGLLDKLGQTGLKTFSIGFEAANQESGDEFVYSDLIAKNFATDHTKVFVPSSQLLEALPATVGAMSEPMVSYDNVAFYMLSQEVAKHVRVVQSGQGADEIFAGYHWYPPLATSNNLVEDYARAFFDRDHATFSRQVNPSLANGDVTRDFVRTFFGKSDAASGVDKALHLDTTVMLVDDPVKRVDNMTMAAGLEARVPFLDHDLVQLAARMPTEEKLRDGGKGILKDVARRVIPPEVIDRPKGYFPVPALKYLDGPYLELARHTLTSAEARRRDLFDRDYLGCLFDDPKAYITPLKGSELWQAALLEMWLQTNRI